MLRIDAIANQSKGKNIYPKLRIGFTLLILVISLFINSLWLYGALIVSASFVIFTLSSIKLKPFVLLLGFPMVFVIFSALIIWMQMGFFVSIQTVIRSLSALCLIYSITLTLPMHHFTAFMRFMRFPSVFIELYELCYRFIFIVIEEAIDMILAQQMRFGFFSWKSASKNLNQTIAALFMRVFCRFHDLENAMALRFDS